MAMPMMPPGMGGLPPGGPGMGVDPLQMLSQMGQQPFPSPMGKGKGSKGNKEGTGGKGGKKGEADTPAAKLEKAADIIQNVINGLGPQSDIGSALAGLARNLNTYVDQLSRPGNAPPDMGQMGIPPVPPLGVGTPGQLPNPMQGMGGPQGMGVGF